MMNEWREGIRNGRCIFCQTLCQRKQTFIDVRAYVVSCVLAWKVVKKICKRRQRMRLGAALVSQLRSSPHTHTVPRISLHELLQQTHRLSFMTVDGVEDKFKQLEDRDYWKRVETIRNLLIHLETDTAWQQLLYWLARALVIQIWPFRQKIATIVNELSKKFTPRNKNLWIQVCQLLHCQQYVSTVFRAASGIPAMLRCLQRKRFGLVSRSLSLDSQLIGVLLLLEKLNLCLDDVAEILLYLRRSLLTFFFSQLWATCFN